MKKFHVIGITGTNGAGKEEVVRSLKSFGGVKHLSVSGFIEEEGLRLDIPLKDRKALRLLGNALRKDHGPDYLVRVLADRVMEDKEGIFIIESLRCLAEVAYLYNKFGFKLTLVGVDAPIWIRYNRVYSRGTMKDRVSFEEFRRQESLEAENTDPWKQNLFACSDMVAPRFRIWNEWDLKYFRKRVKDIAREIGLKRR